MQHATPTQLSDMPAVTIRPSDARGHISHGWLDARHSFSFGQYQDPNWMGFQSLIVINEDRIVPGAGFGEHGHTNMEIITYVLEGELEHRDSEGHQGIIRPGVIQRMTAGRGIRHSEMNASQTNPVHLLQIWIMPETDGLAPGYEEKTITHRRKNGEPLLIASRNGAADSLTIHQDANVYAIALEKGQQTTISLEAGRHLWVQTAIGSANINGQALTAGDGAYSSTPGVYQLTANESADLLLFDLAPHPGRG